MCCLFGILDYRRVLPRQEKNRILTALSIAAEARGTDATGIAYNSGGKLRIYKRALPAHRLHLNIPADARVVMGHTRMTTQGSETKPQNNHPFPGKVSQGCFALAHNGVLHNDRALKREQHLPATSVETDSYVAVQLIEKQNALDLNSLKTMAEQVRGSFVFTVLDDRDTLYMVKGDNPMTIYELDSGVVVYASTKAILEEALTSCGLENEKRKEIHLKDGEILQFSPDGNRQKLCFTLPRRWFSPWYLSPSKAKKSTKKKKSAASSYRDYLVSTAAFMGVPEEEMLFLAETDLSCEDLELALYDDSFRAYCLELYDYYEMEDFYDSSCCYGW